MDSTRRVLITGLGGVTPLGADAPSTWEALLAGHSGVTRIEEEWADRIPVRIAGVVKSDLSERLTVPQTKRLDRAEQFAMLAGREAWQDAGAPAVDPERFAIAVGSAIGGLTTTLAQQAQLEDNPRRVSPHTVTMMMANGSAAWLAIELGAKAGARTPVSACASGSEAIMMGWEMIRAGTADIVLAGGTEACITGLTLDSLAQTRALSRREEDPAAVSRPFDVDRDGFVLGEGAAIVVLESEAHARARGATAIAEVLGAALTSDALDIVNADPVNQERTMRLALRSAGVAPSEVGFVHAHATSTSVGDANEGRAIASIVGPDVPVTSTKGALGHLLGAAGSLGALVAAQALRAGRIPHIATTTTVDPEIRLDVVTGQPRDLGAGVALVNAFGFGGHNVSLVLARA
ncbi:beta-ketoacyl-[acyl-carrier-protein] synthase family protein [Leifsonia poae]|uniref:beta-ketoacyl-[acyl-carrier-protein] synthase family protein n=1 Tax=Leifsonia poae TaxID=110933 RepID=UPI003D674384